MFRFDTNSLRVDKVDINVPYSYHGNILGISNYEVLLSYTSSPSQLIKARYIQINESHSSLNEEYHKSINTSVPIHLN